MKLFVLLYTVLSAGMLVTGWQPEHAWIPQLALVWGGALLGHVLTESLNEGD